MALYLKILALAGKEFQRLPPLNLLPQHRYHFEMNASYKCPDIFIYSFKDVYFLPDSTLFFFRFFPISISFLFYKKRLKIHSIKGLFDIQRRWRQGTIANDANPYLIIHDAWTLNYYHWMTQALPRLLLVLKENLSFTLLLPADHSKPFHIESLKMFGISDWKTFDVGKVYYKTHRLLYPTHDIQIGDYHDDLIQKLAAKFQIQKKRKNFEKPYLYVHRTSSEGRRILNGEEVLAIFLSKGFQIINFENLTLNDQRLLASTANILAGVHGAGLTNMIFMEKGSKVMELTSLLDGEQYYYYTLSNSLGHHYFYQVCPTETSGQTVQESNLFVDIELLRRNVENMINHQS